jgi:hypothetical protein
MNCKEKSASHFRIDNITYTNERTDRQYTNQHINFLYFNAQSLRNSFVDLKNFIETEKKVYHVLIIVETWLTKDDTAYFNMTGYNAIHSIRDNKKGGGASIYIHENLGNSKVLYENNSHDANFVIASASKLNLKCGAVYRPPYSSLDANNENFLNSLDQVLSSHNNAIFFGDFNIDLLSSNSLVEKYTDCVQANGYLIMNNISFQYPTRIDKRTQRSSIIDHILIDRSLIDPQAHYFFHLFDHFGDHKNISVAFIPTINPSAQKNDYKLKVINNKRIKEKKLIENLQASDLNHFVVQLKDIISCNTFEIREANNFAKPFMTHRLLNIIKIRNSFARLHKKFTHANKFLNYYNHYKKLCKKEIAIAKKKYYDKQFTKSCSNPKQFWRNVNEVLGKEKKKENTIECILDNGIAITNNYQIANKLNDFFIKQPLDIAASIVVDEEIVHEYHRKNHNDAFPFPFTCPAVSEDEVKLIITNLKDSATKDIYGMSNKFVKYHATALIPKLASMINVYLFRGVFPECLKASIVTPLYKSGCKKQKINYRCISVLPVISKIFEKVIESRLVTHAEINNVIHKNQYGFVKKSSTTIAMTHIFHNVLSAIDSCMITSLTGIDISKAFDCVVHDILICKLSNLNLDAFFLRLLISYLKDRVQFVKIGTNLSEPKTIVSGVPQGGILSGLLFNIYINDMLSLNLNGALHLYCDDMNLVSVAKNKEDLRLSLQNDLEKINEWMKLHFLKFNATKTKYVLFNGRLRFENFTDLALNVKIESYPVERVESMKILGLVIDEKISFQPHLKQIKPKLFSFMFALKRVRHLISFETAKSMYYAFFHSKLLYMNIIWNAVNRSGMDAVEKLNRKILRCIQNKPRECNNNSLYNECFQPWYNYNRISLILHAFKIKNFLIKNNLAITYVHEKHSRDTRNKADFSIPKINTNFGAMSPTWRALKEFNELPPDLKKIKSLTLFKKRIKEHIYILGDVDRGGGV